MLKRYAQVFVTLLAIADAALTAGAFLLAYHVRFAFFATPKGVPPLQDYLLAAPAVVLAALLCYRAYGLYRPRRTDAFFEEALDVVKASVTTLVLLLALSALVRSRSYSRLVVLLFAVSLPIVLTVSRIVARSVLQAARRRGHNVRRALVVGTGPLAATLLERIHRNRWTGILVTGLVSVDGEPDAGAASTPISEGAPPPPVVGAHEQIEQLVASASPDVDQVFVALPSSHAPELRRIMDRLADTTVDVRFVPDVLGFAQMRANVSDFDGLPLVALREGPLYGWNRLLKRSLDVAVAGLGLIVLAPVLAAIAIAIRAGSRGPALFRQERVGLDGRRFDMLKFRTMVPEAEAAGPKMTTRDDPRTTGLGRLLRRTSMDELPQLWNVLKGEMSLVGPRPERPVFIDELRQTIPNYMLRHKVKAGMTGWAQVNGLRGETSIAERVRYDLFYIENWSLLFDLRVLALTVFRAHRGAI